MTHTDLFKGHDGESSVLDCTDLNHMYGHRDVLEIYIKFGIFTLST